MALPSIGRYVVGTLRYVRSVEFVTYVYSGDPQPGHQRPEGGNRQQ
jgi:hypothetical protein